MTERTPKPNASDPNPNTANDQPIASEQPVANEQSVANAPDGAELVREHARVPAADGVVPVDAAKPPVAEQRVGHTPATPRKPA